MRVVHVLPSVADDSAGPSYSVPRLCEALVELGVDASIATVARGHPRESTALFRAFPLGYGPSRLLRSPKLRTWLRREAKANTIDVVHGHGLWTLPNVYPGAVGQGGGRCRTIYSPRGMLSAWALAQNRVQKQLFWQIFQGRVFRTADCLHATADSEYKEIRTAGLRAPVCIIPNGVDLPPRVPKPRRARRKLLYLGRIHPKKGLDLLLAAWTAVQDAHGDWDLYIVGPMDGEYAQSVKRLADDLRAARVSFRGPLYGDAKLQAYRDADLFVLPSHSENFALTIAEALAAGVPVIATEGTPWSGLKARQAGWWVPQNVSSLTECLQRAMRMSAPELDSMGANGRHWMASEFSWNSVGAKFVETYEWLCGRRPSPAWVMLD